MLEIENISVKVEDKSILEDFSLHIHSGEIHALMGANGAGKSTLSKVIMRDPHYSVTGTILLNHKDLLSMDTTHVAREGVFLVNQNPIEVEGVTNAELLRTALNDMGKNEMNILEFNRKLNAVCEKLDLPKSFIHRDVNYNMSGGEKKKNALFHLWMLNPSFLILDEIDSGLDVDSLKLVAHSILEYYEEYHPAILIITHQKSLLEILKPQFVHILSHKKIAQSGDYSLAEKVFKEGFSGASIIASSDRDE